MDRNDTMQDLFKAGYKKDDILGALRILPFVCGGDLSSVRDGLNG
jgi:hypothetical protein